MWKLLRRTEVRRHFTAKLYECRSMAMGLSNSLATFQRLMELVITGLPRHICMVYLMIIWFTAKHLRNTCWVWKRGFLRIQSADLRPNPKNLVRDHVVFLDHVVSQRFFSLMQGTQNKCWTGQFPCFLLFNLLGAFLLLHWTSLLERMCHLCRLLSVTSCSTFWKVWCH